MPIRKEFRQFYGREWREVIRPRILERAGAACEQCKAPDRIIVARYPEYPGWWFNVDTGAAVDPQGHEQFRVRASEMPDIENAHLVKIVLTVAHLDRVPGHDTDDNLRALCQRCHLHHDRAQHTASSKETRLKRKDAARPILGAGAVRIT